MEIIRSVENARVKLFYSLKQKKYRDKNGLFIIEQPHMITEALSAKLLHTLIVLEGEENPFDFKAMYVSEQVMKKLSENTSLNKYIGICKMPEYSFNDCGRVMVLEKVQDPGNVGTIIRTACSFGYDTVILTNDCADLYNEKTIQSSQGSMLHINILRMKVDDCFKLLKENHYHIISTDLHTDTYLSESKPVDKLAIVAGNEGQGISEYARENADELVKIEMAKFESLNVAIASSIAMYHYRKV